MNKKIIRIKIDDEINCRLQPKINAKFLSIFKCGCRSIERRIGLMEKMKEVYFCDYQVAHKFVGFSDE